MGDAMNDSVRRNWDRYLGRVIIHYTKEGLPRAKPEKPSFTNADGEPIIPQYAHPDPQ
jgi:hypothetical protein